MYKSFSAIEYKNHFGLPDDYEIEGFLSWGGWDDQKNLEILTTTLKNQSLEFEIRIMDNFLSRIYEIRVGVKRYWFTVLYGGAMLSEYVHLACLFGSKKNVHIGACGGLYPEMDSADLLVPDFSFGDDSVTRIYGRDVTNNKHKSNSELSKLLQASITIPAKIWNGPIINCQAMLGESLEDVQAWSKDGYYGVEMETSTVFSVSNHFNIPSASLLLVADNLIKGQTVHDESYKNQKEKRDLLKNEIYKVGIMAIL